MGQNMKMSEKLYHRYEYLAKRYESKIFSYEQLSFEYEDLVQEFRLKIWTSIKSYGKRCSCNNYKKKTNWNIDSVNQFLIDNNILIPVKLGGNNILRIDKNNCEDYLNLFKRVESFFKTYEKTVTFILGVCTGALIPIIVAILF